MVKIKLKYTYEELVAVFMLLTQFSNARMRHCRGDFERLQVATVQQLLYRLDGKTRLAYPKQRIISLHITEAFAVKMSLSVMHSDNPHTDMVCKNTVMSLDQQLPK